MKKLAIIMLLVLSVAGAFWGQEVYEELPVFSLGASAGVYHYAELEGLNLQNFRIGFMLDGIFYINSIGVGLETGIIYGEWTENIFFGGADLVYIDAPVRVKASYTMEGLVLQLFGGFYGHFIGATSTGGTTAFSMQSLYDAGFRIGVGDHEHIYLEYGKFFGVNGYTKIGLGLRMAVINL